MFYRIDGVGDGEFGTLSAERFVALCERLGSYQGAVAARAYEEQEGDGTASRPPPDEDEAMYDALAASSTPIGS